MKDRHDSVAPLGSSKTVLLTTFRRDGTPVGTPVHVVSDGGRLFIRTFDPSGKLKRIRHTPDVLVAPFTARGRVTGEKKEARAHLLRGEESRKAARLMAGRFPVAHGMLIPAFHRMRGFRTTHLELRPR